MEVLNIIIGVGEGDIIEERKDRNKKNLVI
jgi:hypothetical protein